jgi:superoxide reductase
MCAANGGLDKLFDGVNVPADAANLTDLEKKHFPVITAPDSVKLGECFTVQVEVGKLLEHPNMTAHFIAFLELYADERYLGRVDFTPVSTCATATFCVNLDRPYEKLRAFASCNLHGVWEGDRAISCQAQ